MEHPKLLREILAEVAEQQPAMDRLRELLAKPVELDPYARCITCKGTGELCVYREPDTNEFVTRECRDCQGTGIDPTHLLGGVA